MDCPCQPEEREALEARQQAMMEGQQEGRHVSH
ncbi:type-F conjugative transfer system pilin chaperone TraQ (plasmid) [Escherichia coli]|nr:type-F conjugative transfer system pilin chaperone TraQ [Escherichia coli]